MLCWISFLHVELLFFLCHDMYILLSVEVCLRYGLLSVHIMQLYNVNPPVSS